MNQLPAGWTWSTLGEISDVVGGVTKNSKHQNRPDLVEVPYLRVANVQRGRIDLSNVTSIRVSAPKAVQLALQPGDVLLNEGGDRDKLGRGWVWQGQIPGCIHQNHVFRARIRNGLLHPKLLAWYANEVAHGWFELNGRQSVNLASISLSKIRTFPVPIPPVAEQQRIVDILEDHFSRLDAAMASLATAKTRVRALERSALDLHFGSDSDSVPLDELVADISAGKSFGSSNAPAEPGEWGIIKVSAMTWGEFRPEENKAVSAERVDLRFEIRPGDLLVSRANTSEYVGASVLVESVRPKLLLSDKSLRLTPRRGVRVEWLWRALQAPSARRQISALATGTKDSMRNISQASLRRVLLPKSDLDEQVKAMAGFIQIKSAIDRMRTELAFQERRSAALRRSILAAAFSGQLSGRNSDFARVADLASA
jgi:type I restriction enzyme S subunit